MTAPILETQPTFLSVAAFVFFAHLAFTFLLWLSGREGFASDTAELMLKALVFPAYLLSARGDFLPDAVAPTLIILSWLVSAALWGVLVAGVVTVWQRLHTKSSNQTPQPTAGRRDTQI